MTEHMEKLGLIVDKIENYAAALQLSVPAYIHMEQLREALPEIAKELKEVYINETGENPWE